MRWLTDPRGSRIAIRVAATGLVVLLLALVVGARWAAETASDAFSRARVETLVGADYQEALRAANLEADLLDAYGLAPSPAAHAQFERAARLAGDALALAVRDDHASADRGLDTVALERKFLI